MVVRSLNTESLPGICVGDRFYDVTAFLRVHPGGAAIIETFVGKQCDWQVKPVEIKLRALLTFDSSKSSMEDHSSPFGQIDCWSGRLTPRLKTNS